MEAQYLTNEDGENVGVYMDMAQYRAALKAYEDLEKTRRDLAENESVTDSIEGALFEFIEAVREQGVYEDFVEQIEGQFLARGDSPERARLLTNLIENVEARYALEADAEQEDDFVPWSEAKERIAAGRGSQH